VYYTTFLLAAVKKEKARKGARRERKAKTNTERIAPKNTSRLNTLHTNQAANKRQPL
jgi:hypothetical protein